MMATSKREAMYARIKQHGENLLAIYPGCPERDPVALCKRLRRIEAKAARLALAQCNGGAGYIDDDEKLEAEYQKLADAANNILRSRECEPVVFINRDPRGYQLKIEAGSTDELKLLVESGLHRDWGGYGIIAPDFSED
jgi:hypothetical protein